MECTNDSNVSPPHILSQFLESSQFHFGSLHSTNKQKMSSRISLTVAALALFALTDVPSVHARVGTESVSKNHPMLRRELSSLKIPDVIDKDLVNSVDLDVVQIPKWSEVELGLGLPPASQSNTSKDGH